MSSRSIILDVRSGERNDSSTGLCLRVVDGGASQVDGRWERVGRDLYEIGSNGVDSYALIASGDGEIGVESVDITFTPLGECDGHWYYLTNSRVWLSSVRDENGNVLDHFFGGTIVKTDTELTVSPTEGGIVGSGVCGGLFWWTRNDESRTRFDYENRGWSLLKGGEGSVIGIVGGDDDIIAGLEGELRIGGGNVADASVTVYEIGGADFPVYAEGSEPDPIVTEGVVLNPSGKVLFKEGSEHIGKSVLYISGTLGGFESNEVGVSGYLSPKPRLNEFPLLRVAGYGYSEIVFVATEGGLVDAEYGKVKISLDSGRILSRNPVIYDGLVLCDAPIGVGAGKDGLAVDLMKVPDGSGLEPSADLATTNFGPSGIGLKSDYRHERVYVRLVEEGRTLPVDLVTSLPKKKSTNRGYLVQDTETVSLHGFWQSQTKKIFNGHIALSRGGLRHMSILKLTEKSGSFKVDGAVVSFTGETVVGSGVSVVNGFLVVDEGSVVDHPSTVEEFESLKAIGLVPHSSLETGLEFVLTRSSIKGYYSYDEEKVADISGKSAFQFLQFEPRVDFSGYEANKFFKVGDKILGDTDIEPSFGGNPNGFQWIKPRSISSKVSQETSRLALGSGLRVGSTAISISQEQMDGTVNTQELTEGVDYDLPSSGLEGQARLINRLGSEVLSGQKVGSLTGVDLDLEVDLTLVREGDFFYEGLNYFKIVAITGTVVTLSSALGLQLGRWKIYRGYREGLEAEETPDPTKIVGEILDDLPILERKAVEVSKVYSTVAFDKVLPSSDLFIRKGDASYPLTVLRDEAIEPPYELSGDHYTSGSYRIKVGGVEYEVGVGQTDDNGVEKGFTVTDNRVVFESPMGVSNSSWLAGEAIFVRKPRSGLTTTAEMDLSLTMTTPFDPDPFDDFLELLANPKFEPTSGAISFEDPLDENVGVEVSYTPTDDDNGVRIIESMGFAVIQEESTRVDGFHFTYNPTGKVVELLATPTVFVGPEQINANLYSIDQNTIRFSFEVSSGKSVKVSYTTLKSNGGDGTVRTSSSMVIPKYKIDKGSTELSVQRDFTSILSAGDLIYVGTQLFNLTSVSATSLSVSPPARVNLETDMIAFLNVPSFTYGATTSSYAFRSINGALISSGPNSPDIYIQGDYRDFIQAKSILVIEGIPYRAKVVGLDEKTGMTKVTVEGFTSGHGLVSNENFHVSFRPVLIEGDTSITLSTGLIDTESFQLIKYNHTQGRGRLLTPREDYQLNSEAGLIDLTNGHDVRPQVSYYFLHTALSAVKPFTLLGGRVSKPKYKATFNQSTTPESYDGLGLNVSCVVSSPDTFQVRIADEEAYSSEIANELQQSLNQDTGSGGKQVISSPTSQGKAIGVYDLLANDVVARSRISLYNGYVQPIDDIISTATGKVVGDADGSFKFNLLTSGDWIATGMEDSITREIYPRYVSMEFLTPSNPFPTPNDTIKINGEPPEAKDLNKILQDQRSLIENEMDDIVLVRQREIKSFDITAPLNFFVKVDYEPVYSPMWKRHQFSRLFPTVTRMYSYRFPGTLNSSTNGITIGNAQNNALGQIENISSLPVVKRRPARFRVYDFSLNGYPNRNVDETVGKPTFILSALPFDEFPTDSAGLPDTTKFLSDQEANGTLADVIHGNVDKTFNGLSPNSKVKLSRSGGEFHSIINTADTATLIDVGVFPPLAPQTEARNARVKEIIKGCYVVLDGNIFTLKINGESLFENPPKRGDTLIESFDSDLDEAGGGTPAFRVGSDIGLKYSTGELIDISLPSIDDPNWPIKEILGQNVPSGGMALEGNVSFRYSESTPFRYPALDGEALDDTGDESIPYMSRFSEKDLLPQLPPALASLRVQTNNTISSADEYVYPDDARGTANVGSTSITTNEDFSVLNGVCEQVPRQGDLIILKPDPANQAGCASTGVLELAVIEGTEILPPTFTTPCDVECEIENLIVYLQDTGGITIQEEWHLNPSNNLYDSSKFKMTFASNNQGGADLFSNPLSGDEITIHIHNFSDNTNNPNENIWTIILSYDGANWTLKLKDELTNAETTATNITSVSASGSEVTIIQDPVPNTFNPATDTWGTNTQMESWSYDRFWDGSNIHYNSGAPSGGSMGFFLLKTQAGVPSSIDYRISLKRVAQIANNRVDIVFSSLPSPVSQIDNTYVPVGLDTSSKIKVNNSSLTVKEEGGAGTQVIGSDVNNTSVGLNYTSINATTLRPKALDGISRTNDQMSIFVGSEVDETDTICKGTARSGLVEIEVDANDPAVINIIGDKGTGVLREVQETHGDVAHVLTGDLLYIENGHNAGTHRVLDVIETDINTEITETLGSSQVLTVQFPKVVSLNTGTGVLTTDVADLTQYFSDLTAGSIYIILNDNYTNTPTPLLTAGPALAIDPVFGVSIIKVDYELISESQITLKTPFACEYADGTAIADATALNTILGEYNQVIGGLTKIPFNLEGTGLASNGLSASFGVDLTLQMTVGGGRTGTTNAFSESGVVRENGLVTHITLDVSDANLYPDIEDSGGQTYGKPFLSPNDTITLTVKLDAGLYLDTAFPRLLRDYNGNTPVKFGDTPSQVRSPIDSTLTNLPNPTYDFYEEVTFTVRRLRRFTNVFSKLIYAFEGFRYLYEQRVGRVDSVTYADGVVTLTPKTVDGEGVFDESGGTDTQVGDFTNVVSVGDQVRCFNDSNQETLYMRILEVGSTLKCSVIRGSVSAVEEEDVFKIITRVPLIPELQAFDQFIEHGFTEIYSTTPQEGISVDEVSRLTDTTADFNSLGVTSGDFLVIDPQGALVGSSPTQYGAPPQGDNGDGSIPADFGVPNVLDDNRGAYKVVSVVDANTLAVQFYAGDSGTTRTNYKLLPSVSGDDAQHLRVTAGIVGSSYATTNDSIHPFSYRILRRKPTLGESLAGSFLFFRERTLSWVEVIRSFNSLPTQPYTWSQYEAESLIDNVGVADLTHPSNDLLLQNILGNEADKPFKNNETCLSIYDRRMLIEDLKMESDGYGEVEDGLPTVLENDISSMNARGNRYAWISVRTEQVNGTLSKLSRVNLNNPDDTALEDIK